MSDTEWVIKGQEFVHCSCAYGCPCQFNALPTHGSCEAVAVVEIEEGHHGDTPLSGLRFAAILAWPGAIHEGHGQVVPIIDERADEAQRDAIVRIMSGLDTVPGATFLQVFATTYETVHEPVFTRIDFDLDIDKRSAKLTVPGYIDARGEPILNPVSGEEHRARINLPNGFEYDIAEVGRGWASTRGPIQIELKDSHAQFAKLHMTGKGVIH